MRVRKYRRRRRRRAGRGIPKIRQGKIYFGRGQRGGGGLSALVSKLVYNIGDAIGIQMRVRRYRKKRRYRTRKRKQGGGVFGFEYLMNKLAGRKQHPQNSLHKLVQSL